VVAPIQFPTDFYSNYLCLSKYKFVFHLAEVMIVETSKFIENFALKEKVKTNTEKKPLI